MRKDKEELWLNCFEEEVGVTGWCWNTGMFASQVFRSEEEALDAWRNGAIHFTSADNEDVLGALYATAEVNEDLRPPFDYWCVDGSVVREPFPAGVIVGTLPNFFIPKAKKILRMTRHEFEALEAAWELEQEQKS